MYAGDGGVSRGRVTLVTIRCGLRVLCEWWCCRHRWIAVSVTGSRLSGCGRWATRIVRWWWSMSLTSSRRSSARLSAWSRASSPTRASWGCTAASLVQRRNRRRCSPMVSVSPVKPRWGDSTRSVVGSTSTIRFLRAKAKNCRSEISRRRRLVGWVFKNASMSAGCTVDQSVLERSSTRNLAKSRTLARLPSMVESVRGRVPARIARCRDPTMRSQNSSTPARSGSGVASTRRWRRPAARRAG